MTNQQSAELAQSCVGGLDDPASFVSPEFPSVFVLFLLIVFAVRNDEVDAALFEPLRFRQQRLDQLPLRIVQQLESLLAHTRSSTNHPPHAVVPSLRPNLFMKHALIKNESGRRS